MTPPVRTFDVHAYRADVSRLLYENAQLQDAAAASAAQLRALSIKLHTVQEHTEGISVHNDTLHDALAAALAAGIEQQQALDALSDELRADLAATHPDHLTLQETS